MLHKWICLGILTLSLTSPTWSQEPPVSPGIKKQRVSPKLLREAMASPEYKAQVNPASPPPSVEHLQRLSEKLKDGGDKDGGELLQHFIQEHQRLASQSALNPEAAQSFSVRCQMVSVDFRKISKDSILHTGIFDSTGVLDDQSVEAFGKELDRAVREKKGKNLFEPVTLRTRTHQTTHFHQGGLFPIPSSDGSPSKAFREIGTILDVVVTPIDDSFNQVELKIEMIGDGESDVSDIPATAFSRLKHQKMQPTIETKNGAGSIVCTPWDDHGHKVFLVTKVFPSLPVTTALPTR